MTSTLCRGRERTRIRVSMPEAPGAGEWVTQAQQRSHGRIDLVGAATLADHNALVNAELVTLYIGHGPTRTAAVITEPELLCSESL
jgi:hypothetical protein